MHSTCEVFWPQHRERVYVDKCIPPLVVLGQTDTHLLVSRLEVVRMEVICGKAKECADKVLMPVLGQAVSVLMPVLGLAVSMWFNGQRRQSLETHKSS
jgi:hypothetical protein